MSRPVKATLLVDRTVATLVRRVAGYEGRRLSAVLADMAGLYIGARWPDLDLTQPVGTYSGLPAAEVGRIVAEELKDLHVSERRTGAERRGTKPTVGRPVTVADRRRRPRRAS